MRRKNSWLSCCPYPLCQREFRVWGLGLRVHVSTGEVQCQNLGFRVEEFWVKVLAGWRENPKLKNVQRVVARAPGVWERGRGKQPTKSGFRSSMSRTKLCGEAVLRPSTHTWIHGLGFRVSGLGSRVPSCARRPIPGFRLSGLGRCPPRPDQGFDRLRFRARYEGMTRRGFGFRV